MFIVNNSLAVEEAYESLMDGFYEKCPVESAKFFVEESTVTKGFTDMMDLVAFAEEECQLQFPSVFVTVMEEEIMKEAEGLYEKEYLTNLSAAEVYRDIEEISDMSKEIGDFPL